MREQKLANALVFLSLNALSRFEESLWIAPSLAGWRHGALRATLEESVRTQQFHVRFQEFCSRVFRSLEEYNQRDVWRSALSWADLVYIHGGDDRSPERIWSLILAQRWAQDQNAGELSTELDLRLRAIHEKVSAERSRLAPLVATIASGSLTEWDAMVLPQIHLEPDFLAEKVDLLIGYNQLIRAWKSDGRFQMHELCEIYEWGKTKSGQFGIREIDLPFPGCWEYGLSDFGI